MSDSFPTPWDCSPPGSFVHGILQARILEWVAISFSRASSRLRDPTCIGRQILYHWATYEAHNSVYKEFKGYSWLTYISRTCFLQGGERVNWLAWELWWFWWNHWLYVKQKETSRCWEDLEWFPESHDWSTAWPGLESWSQSGPSVTLPGTYRLSLNGSA